ncbi:hypothetical protein Nepgr_018780 [Nepenthes gracilis]|uniref:Uncharacterized protein n=1 Tax=Nepenthes gracilis TaxID=150966 RepID=A0AAD3SUI1_NEPGR|nr:hypothetical protein Nepgr_018780 [Nepenthes gracilis]
MGSNCFLTVASDPVALPSKMAGGDAEVWCESDLVKTPVADDAAEGENFGQLLSDAVLEFGHQQRLCDFGLLKSAEILLWRCEDGVGHCKPAAHVAGLLFLVLPDLQGCPNCMDAS